MNKHGALNLGLPLLLLLAAPSIATAQSGCLFEFMDDFTKPCRCQRNPFEERIETERHDFTQSAVTVGRHIVQIETGYSYFYKDDPEEESSHTYPETLLRIGLSEDIEFRLRFNYASVFIENQDDRSGAEDLRYSLKLQISRQDECNCCRPTSALEVRGSAPTGGSDFTTGSAEFSLDYIYQWQIADGLTFAGSTGFGTNGFGDFGLVPEDTSAVGYFNVYTQSFVSGLELGEQNTVYAEWFGIYSDGLADEFTISVFNLGIDHYFTRDFVFDFRAGVGLSGDSDDFFTGVGGGYRF